MSVQLPQNSGSGGYYSGREQKRPSLSSNTSNTYSSSIASNASSPTYRQNHPRVAPRINVQHDASARSRRAKQMSHSDNAYHDRPDGVRRRYASESSNSVTWQSSSSSSRHTDGSKGSRVVMNTQGSQSPNPHQPPSRLTLRSKSRSSHNGSMGSATSFKFRSVSQSSRLTTESNRSQIVDPDEEIMIGEEMELHNACRLGDLAAVGELLAEGVDVNCRNKHDRTALHWACGNGHMDIIKILIDEGASIDSSDKFGMNSLLWAAWFGHKECAQHMVRAGVKPNSRNKQGFTLLHCAAQNNHLRLLDILQEELQDFDKNLADDDGRTAVHVACKFERLDILRRLLRLGLDAGAKDKGGNAPIHIAAKQGFHQAISVLVAQGCSLEDANSSKKSPLHIAAEEGRQLFCVCLLAEGVDVNVENEDEMCPLHYAVIGGRADVIDLLLEHGADVDAGNKHNQSPLHFAVARNNLAVAKLLVEAGACTSVADARGETVLHLAAENGLLEMTEILLKAKTRHGIVDQKGKTPLDVAARGNYVVIVDMIIKAERVHHASGLHNLDAEGNALDYKNLTFLPDKSIKTQQFRSLLYRLGTKYLKSQEWRQLAYFWGFTDHQLQAIEEQYTGGKSWKEHGHRMLLIWLHGCQAMKLNPGKGLYEGLVSIQRRDLAETMRNKANNNEEPKSCCIS